jgi:hypothetical protein
MPIESHMTGLFNKALLGFGFLAFSASVSALASGSGSLRLSGQVEPQLNVTTTIDWSNWVLRLDNASNVENDTYWIHLGESKPVRLDRTAVVNLASWMARTRALPGTQFRVTIASP